MGTQSDLWGGPGVKQEHAFYFWRRMQHALEPPPRTQINVAMQSGGTIIGRDWQQSFYANFDAFLAMARSVPEIINVRFGYDDRAPKPIRDWFDALDPGEQQRRKEFTKQFAASYGAFRALPLSNKRNVTFHRTGVSGVKVTIVGRFGIYTGSATEPVPQAESMPIPSDADPNVPWPALIRPTALEPKWSDFQIDGRPLYEEVTAYFEATGKLVSKAHKVAEGVHGTNTLSEPTD